MMIMTVMMTMAVHRGPVLRASLTLTRSKTTLRHIVRFTGENTEAPSVKKLGDTQTAEEGGVTEDLVLLLGTL